MSLKEDLETVRDEISYGDPDGTMPEALEALSRIEEALLFFIRESSR